MPNKSYLAITIGPIYQTFMNARHTREVWGASYMFSYIAKGLILKLIDSSNKIDADVDFDQQVKPQVGKFILPNINDAQLFKKNSPVGLFPDNIIVEANILNTRDFVEIKNAVFDELSGEIAVAIGVNKTTVLNFIQNYFCIIHRILAVASPILDVTPVLSVAEQLPYFNHQVPQNYLSDFLKTINNKTNGFMNKRNIGRFESLVEISTVQLSSRKNYSKFKNEYLWINDEDIDSDGKFVGALMQDCKDEAKSTKTDSAFKTYHKYVAVVKADGDKIGSTLKKINDAAKVKSFSNKLLKWGLATKTLLQHWQAKAIFIGGDDLLFFAPIVNKKGENIFDLIKQIDEVFKAQNWEDLKAGVEPTLSYGISITYYKYPLIEALETADSLLYKSKSEGGNRLAVRFLKHSGAELPFTLAKQDACFDELFKKMDSQSKETKSLVSRVFYKVRENQAVFELIGKDKTRVQNIFQNVFEEIDWEDSTRQSNQTDAYLKAFRDLLDREYAQTEEVKLANQQVFSITRAIKFIKGLDELKD